MSRCPTSARCRPGSGGGYRAPGKVAVAATAVLLLGLTLAFAPGMVRDQRERSREAAQRRAAAHAALVARVNAEQRPRLGRGPAANGDVEARGRLLADVAASLEADARTRAARILRVDCEPFPPGASAADRDPRIRAGTFQCLAVTGRVPATSVSPPGWLGAPYLARIDFVSGRYAYCRVAPRASKALRGETPLSRVCSRTDSRQNVQGQPG